MFLLRRRKRENHKKLNIPVTSGVAPETAEADMYRVQPGSATLPEALWFAVSTA